MDILHSKIRWLAIPALVLALATTGVSSCLQFAAQCGSQGLAQHKARTCCCCKGTCNGRCGMACCQKPAPTQDQVPAEPKSHDDSGPSVGLVSAIPAGIDFASAGASQHDGFTGFAAASACPSLLALNIRFNV
jgi:hypothetical protein